MRTPRRRAREFAVQSIYQLLLNHDYSAETVIRHVKESDAFIKAVSAKKSQVDEVLFEELVRGVFNNKLRYAQLIRPLLTRDESEVSPIEYSILFLACHELSAMPQTPYPVIIDEAVEICKGYGGVEGYKFINGILDKLALNLRPNDPVRRLQ